MVHRDPRSRAGDGRRRTRRLDVGGDAGPQRTGRSGLSAGLLPPGHALSRRPHPDELEGVAQAITWGMELGWISPATVILGHRDNPAHPGATACPGDYVQAQLPTIRRRVAADNRRTHTPTPTRVTTLEAIAVIRYFKLGGDNLTVWATSDGLIAVRLEPYVFDQHAWLPVCWIRRRCRSLPESERGLYMYHAAGCRICPSGERQRARIGSAAGSGHAGRADPLARPDANVTWPALTDAALRERVKRMEEDLAST